MTVMPVENPVPLRPPSVIDRAAAREQGRSRRRSVGRSKLAGLSTGDRDPVGHLREQNADRVAELVPLRMQRMLADPFAFYRGTAGLMALDLSDAPSSGVHVAACGDAHLSNFGFYASPERTLVFDLNDFDEAAIAPWEWDVKRLVASVVIGGRQAGYAEDDIARVSLAAVGGYARTLRQLANLSPAERYFMHYNTDLAFTNLSKEGRRAMRRATAAAEKRTGARAVRRTTERAENGRLRFIDRPPTMVRFTPLQAATAGGRASAADEVQITDLFAQYRATVNIDIELMLAQYEPTDLARRVVGVGSVGTRCYLQLLEGPDGDALVLQVKEAGTSVLARYGNIAQGPRITAGVAKWGDGSRVVGMQRVLQAASDPFLGHFRGPGRDYFVRQFNDMKGSIDMADLPLQAFDDYVQACAVVLGRAHAQSPTAAQVVGYIGEPDTAAHAILDWSLAYAEISRSDFEAARAEFADLLAPAAAD